MEYTNSNSFEMGGGASKSIAKSGDISAHPAPDFIQHVFLFDDSTKSELLNIAQYATLAAVPISFLIKMMNKYIAPSNPNKSSLELIIEILAQIIALFFGLFFIHRIITFVPTYSGENYPKVDVLYVVLSVMVITMSLQTKLGEKMNVLSKRVMELWSGVPQPGAYGPVQGQDGQQPKSNTLNYDMHGYPLIGRPIVVPHVGVQDPMAAPTPQPVGQAEMQADPDVIRQPMNALPPMPAKRYKAMKT